MTSPTRTGQISPGRGAARLGDDRGAVGDLCLAQVVVRHAPAAAGEHLADDLGHAVVVMQRHTHHAGDRVAGEVVVGGAEPAADDHRVGIDEHPGEHSLNASEVVADLHLQQRVDPRRGELFADPLAVRVGDLAEQQFRADGEDVTPHGRPASNPRGDGPARRTDRR